MKTNALPGWLALVLFVSPTALAEPTVASTNTVRIAAAQAARRLVDFHLKPGEALAAVDKNLAELERIVERAGEAKCDALVLPEDTPGLLNWVGANETLVKEVLPSAVKRMRERLGAAAARHHMYLVVCSDFLENDGAIYNTAFLLGRDGKEIGRYHKVCPTWGESGARRRGNSFPVFPTPDLGTAGMLICYDLVIPETARCLAVQGADIIFFPTMGAAAIGDDDIGVQALRVRAAENFIWLVVAQRGSGAMIISPQGKIIARADGPDGLAIADIDPRGQREGGDATNWQHDMRARLFRERNPAAFGALTDTNPPVLAKVPIDLTQQEAGRIMARTLTVGENDYKHANDVLANGRTDEAISAFEHLRKEYPATWIDRKSQEQLVSLQHSTRKQDTSGLGFAAKYASDVSVVAENWPNWRGPAGTGIANETQLPLHWGTNENVLWRASLPERGNSTPIVWDNRVFVTQAIEAENRRALLCFERATGQLLWQRGVVVDAAESTHEANPQASSSPVTDGERVIAWFGSAGLFCYDLQGKELWRRELGPQKHVWGWGSSPSLDASRCYLNFGPGEPSFLVALDKKTGSEVWRVRAPNADSGGKRPGQEQPVWAGSWSTPVMIQAGGREELIMTWPKRVLAFEPKTGRELWSCAGINPLVYTSPLYEPSKEIVVAMGGFFGMALAVKAGGSGDVTETRRLWHHPKTKQRIGSGVIHDGHIYILNDPGIAECFELETGKLIWEERLHGPAAKSDNWSSMVVADAKLYAINQGGDSFVLRASPNFEVLATNSISEPTIASMAVSNGDLFIRTHKALWCFRQSRR